MVTRATGPAAVMSPKPMVDTAWKLNHRPSPSVFVAGSASHTATEHSANTARNTAVIGPNPAWRSISINIRNFRMTFLSLVHPQNFWQGDGGADGGGC